MSKSAITISDDGTLVRKRMFSSLFTSHKFGPKILSKVGKANDKRERQHT